MVSQRIALYRGRQFSATFGSLRVPARWATQVAWLLTVEGVAGAPTACSLRVKPQVMVVHSRNQLEEGRFQSTQDPLWADIGAHNSNMLLDGAFGEVASIDTLGALPSNTIAAVDAASTLSGSAFGSLIATTDANPAGAIIVAKRTAGGYWQRLYFDMTFTGGTSPAFQISLEAVLT